MSRIMIIGDIHGSWGELNAILNRRKPSLVLQTGDFGFFPHELAMPHRTESGGIRRGPRPKSPHPYNPEGLIKNKGVPVHWCDGNHEDHRELLRLQDGSRKAVEVVENVFYQPRGSTLVLPDGRRVLFMGGALSHDRTERTPGVDWFEEEVISQEDLDGLPDTAIDIVISHTCPTRIVPELSSGCDFRISIQQDRDPSWNILDMVFERYRPSRWYFGHWHGRQEGEVDGCRWTLLNMTPYAGCWAWLD